ncbi:MAG: phosphoribosylglycinamide formyltransferase [Firmicutes bacterium]|nr:phosphoribosylglycinamide formyltransferase [Bacillota bacterium]
MIDEMCTSLRRGGCQPPEDCKSTINIAVFASGGGSDLQAIIDGCKAGKINAAVGVVISNNSKSMALQRARDEGIPAFHFSGKTVEDPQELEQAILNTLLTHKTDIIFLAGYMKKVGQTILHTYRNRIYNIHPALLPKYGGKGMFGINVHKAVIDAGEDETGITIHRVDPEYDTGEIIAQCTVPVEKDDTPETLAARVLAREHTFLVETLGGVIVPSLLE